MKRDYDITAIVCWIITCGYMIIIFILSAQHNIHFRGLPENIDKVVHVLIYIPLAFMLYISLNKSGCKKSLFIVAFIFAGIYGISDEFHQYYVPGRDASAGDIAADFFGAFLGSTGAKHFVKSKFNFVSQHPKKLRHSSDEQLQMSDSDY